MITVSAQRIVNFSDVHATDWFSEPVNFLKEKGWISGYKDKLGNPTGIFNPSGQVTKAEITKIAFLMSGAIEDQRLMPQNILAQSHWAKHWIALAEGLDINLWDGNVNPNEKATRAEVLRLIFEIIDQEPTLATTSDFPDVQVDHRYFQYIQAAKDLGIITGYPDGLFRPDNPVSRAEIAKIIMNVYQKLVDNTSTDKVVNASVISPQQYEKYATDYVSVPFEFEMKVPGFYRFRSFPVTENEIMRFGFTTDDSVELDNVLFWLKIIGTEKVMDVSIRKKIGRQIISDFPRKGFSRSFFRIEGDEQYAPVMRFVQEHITYQGSETKKEKKRPVVPAVIRDSLGQ